MDVPTVSNPKPEPKRRGNYAISSRLQQALLLLTSSECRTQREACDRVGMSVRNLQLALRRPSVQAFMKETIMQSLGISAMRAAKRLDELLHSSNEMVSFQASRYALGVGANVVMPAAPHTAVQVNIGQPSGYILDLRTPAEMVAPLTPEDRGALDAVAERRSAGAVLNGSRGESPQLEGVTEPIDEQQ
jgi:hypothetical protein